MKANAATKTNGTLFSTKQTVILGLFSALSYVLMFVHLPYKHLGFLELEFSDIPAIIAALQFGPLSGIMIEFIKNLIKALTASSTGMVGELANFLISCAFILPVGILNKIRKSKAIERNLNQNTVKANTGVRSALAMVVIFTIATLSMTLTGALLNYFVMIPLYATLFGGLDNVVGLAATTVPAIKDLGTMVIIGITPFNIFKGIMISVVGYYTYRLTKGVLFR
ncbi:MAG: putative riboflavin transporter [Herbinix sp.]|jgi:riboflavin transporter FmnP|nr:putative riboflavin transporter [Herbinix sp.]